MNNELIDIEKIISMSNDLNIDYIDNLASNKLSYHDFIDIMKIKYKYLFENHESIFKICTSKSYDSNRLKFMLTMSNKVKNNELSEHDASVKVGQELVHNIVKPQLDKAGVYPNKK